MSLYTNFTFQSTGAALASDADFLNAANGTIFEKNTGELFTKVSNTVFEIVSDVDAKKLLKDSNYVLYTVTNTGATVSTDATGYTPNIWMDSSGGSFSLTLPDGYENGQTIIFSDISGSCATYPVTINGTIVGDTFLLFDMANVSIQLEWRGNTYGWRLAAN